VGSYGYGTFTTLARCMPPENENFPGLELQNGFPIRGGLDLAGVVRKM
jgi:hypothetical protein